MTGICPTYSFESPYRSLESILKSGLDAQPLPAPPPCLTVRRHDNVRGPAYYR